MADEEDEFGFDKEQIEPIVQKAVDETLLPETYDDSRVQLLVDLVCERVLAGLGGLALPMKFIGTQFGHCEHYIFPFFPANFIIPILNSNDTDVPSQTSFDLNGAFTTKHVFPHQNIQLIFRPVHYFSIMCNYAKQRSGSEQ
mmetsp:Transcript_24383/g.48625  ORF Transcript_24383/g.48625 Transcript_24383/m.48625 type:complete len:142 (+) Transcript_24383:95-520(+)